MVTLKPRALGLALLMAAFATTGGQAQEFDLLIRRGLVFDGTGTPGFIADVAVRGDRIALVSRDLIDPARAGRVINANGMVVAPGFIDAHAHIEELAERPLAESFLRQGVTTVVYAADGGMPAWPLDPYLAALRAGGHAPNAIFFAGHNQIRRNVMGTADREPTADELERMKTQVAQAMDAGAIGLSTGLRYVPGIYSRTDEVVALAKVAAGYGGIYSSHIRDEGAGIFDAVREVVTVAREAGLPGQVSHHKLMGQPQWGGSLRTLAIVDSARAEGLDVTIDQYAYDATSTGTAVLFPAWSLAGGNDSLRSRLADPALRQRIDREMRETILEERGGGDLSRIRIAAYAPNSDWNGKTFADIAAERGVGPTMDFAVELAIEIQTNGGASGVWHVVDEADIRRIMVHPWTMFSSDGRIGVLDEGHPHPRNYGAFARVLGRYVRDAKVLPMEEAIRKMTALPAWRMLQPERGRIETGLYADLTVFDPDRVSDRATYTDPHQFSVGVLHVIVNGVPVLFDGSLTGAKPGRVLTLNGG